VDAPDPPATPTQTPTPTPRPRPLDPAPAVRWLSPTELGRTGVKVLLGSLFGQYVDKREIQQGPSFDQGEYFDHTRGTAVDEPYWLDYVSDIGDGFDATYSVASLLAGDLDKLDGSDRDVLPRGSILVMGGDEVYPTGDVRNYERRTTDVYAAALPDGGDPRPVAYAVPGNHDWYDGLTSFLRVWCSGRPRRWAVGIPSSSGPTSHSGCRIAGGCLASTSSSTPTSTGRSWSTSARSANRWPTATG